MNSNFTHTNVKKAVYAVVSNKLLLLCLVFLAGWNMVWGQTSTYTSNSTWTNAASGTLVIECWGGGGGGGGAANTSGGGTVNTGGGGGGGAYSKKTYTYTANTELTITVGTGGSGGSGSTASKGGDGGNSRVTLTIGGSVICRAAGGIGAWRGRATSTHNASSVNTTGNNGGYGGRGLGGAIADCIGDAVNIFKGGDGANGGTTSGGGGGGAGSSGAGGSTTTGTAGTGTSNFGGNGGAGISSSSNNGNAGSSTLPSNPSYGGGGSGGRRNSTSGSSSGGAGRQGYVVLTFTACTPPSITSQPSSQAVCGNTSVSFSASASGTITGYQWEYKLGASAWFEIPNGSWGTTGSTTNTLTIANPVSDDWDNGEIFRCKVLNGAGCFATSNEASLTVNALPANPGNPTSNSPQCASTGVTLTRSGSPPAGVTWYWQTTASGTSTASSATTYNVSTTGTYYIRARDNTTLCWSSGAGSLAVTVNVTPPAPTDPVNYTGCAGTAAMSVTVPFTSIVDWYTDVDLTTSAYDTTATGTISYSPTLSSSQTYYVTRTVPATGCRGPATTVTATVTPATVAPTFTAGPTTLCANSTSTYTATTTQGTISYSIVGGSGAAINASTGELTSAGTSNFTVRATSTNSPCGELTTDRAVTVAALPTITASSGASRCGTGTLGISATASAGSIEWFDASSGGTSQGTSASAASWTTPSISATTTYYAEAVNGSCRSAARTAVTATINQPATTISDTLIPDEAYLWGGTTNGNWSEATNWYRRTGSGYAVASAAPGETTDVYIFPTTDDACITANNALVNANPVNAKDVYIASGAFLEFNDITSIDVYGNFTNLGSLVNNASTDRISDNRIIRFSGASDQYLNTGGTNDDSANRKRFRSIEINKSGGDLILINNDLSYSGSINFVSGNINLNGKKIIMEDNATIVDETNDRRIYGTSGGTVETTRTFGSALADQTFGGIGITVTTAVAPGATTIKRGHTQQTGLGNESIYRYFDIQPTTNTGLNATLSMVYYDNEVSVTHIEENLKFYRSTDAGLSWLRQSESSVNTGSNYMEMTAIDAFSRWTISDEINQPLPVEFLGMDIACQRDNEVIINWSTASEVNTNYFALERSRDGFEWEVVGEEPAAGNSSTQTNYSFTDESAGPNFEGYFRLRQVDIDGKFELFAPLFILCNNDKIGRVEIYPNPSDGKVQVFIYAEQGMEGPAVLELKDAIGKLVHRQDFTIQPGAAAYPINFSDKQSGMYYLNITFANSQQLGAKLMKN